MSEWILPKNIFTVSPLKQNDTTDCLWSKLKEKYLQASLHCHLVAKMMNCSRNQQYILYIRCIYNVFGVFCFLNTNVDAYANEAWWSSQAVFCGLLRLKKIIISEWNINRDIEAALRCIRSHSFRVLGSVTKSFCLSGVACSLYVHVVVLRVLWFLVLERERERINKQFIFINVWRYYTVCS